MNARSFSHTLLPFATLALCGSLALAQETPAPPTPASPTPPAAADTQAQPAPVERHAPRPPRPPRPPRVAVAPRPPMDPMMHEHFHGDFRSGPMGFGMERKWWTDSEVAQQLNLTPDQIKRMDSAFEQSKLQLIDLRANVQKQEVLLEPLLSANPVDTAKATAQIEKVARARADLEVASAKMLLGIRAVLTPEQWTKLNERHGRHRMDFGPGGPGGPGAPPAPPAGGPGGPGR